MGPRNASSAIANIYTHGLINIDLSLSAILMYDRLFFSITHYKTTHKCTHMSLSTQAYV